MVAFVRCEEGVAARSEPPPRALTTQLSADRLEALKPPPALAGSPAGPVIGTRLRAARALVFLCDVDLLPSAQAELAAVPAAYWATPRLAVVVRFATTSDRAARSRGAARVRAPRSRAGPASCRASSSPPTTGAGGRRIRRGARCRTGSRASTRPSTSRAATPNFDERFDGYGKNKVQFVQGLRGAGWTFWVLPRAFVIHAPHSLSAAGSQWQHSRTGEHKARMDRLFEQQLADARAAAVMVMAAAARRARRSASAR